MVVSGSNCYSATSNPPNLNRNLSAHSRLSNGVDDKLVSMRLTFHLQNSRILRLFLITKIHSQWRNYSRKTDAYIKLHNRTYFGNNRINFWDNSFKNPVIIIN